MSFDLREYKNELRERSKSFRRELSPEEKSRLDAAVLERVLLSEAYRSCDVLLTYVSTEIEVDTHALIRKALADGKRVSAPRCIQGTRLMDFYYIRSPEDLCRGSFSVSEPIIDRTEKTESFEGALCIVPGLVFDMNGYRLGYGKGYYDRFLAAHPDDMTLMGLCYCQCTVQSLVSGRFDRQVNLLATEKYIKTITEVCRVNG